jgi:hypothetical protein
MRYNCAPLAGGGAAAKRNQPASTTTSLNQQMPVSIKSEEEFARMRVAGRHGRGGAGNDPPARAARRQHRRTGPDLPRLHRWHPAGHAGTAATTTGFRSSICTSSTTWSVTASRDSKKLRKSGDIVNIDVTVIKDGYHGDSSIMVGVGKVPAHADRLIASPRNASIAPSKSSSPVHVSATSAM